MHQGSLYVIIPLGQKGTEKQKGQKKQGGEEGWQV
jgi:hypothetical protein